jgi:hypothetical protein
LGKNKISTTPLMATELPNKKINFKKYDQQQYVSVPIDISSFIGAGHIVRIIDGVVEAMYISVLESYYVGGGSSSYHPKMLIKVCVYGDSPTLPEHLDKLEQRLSGIVKPEQQNVVADAGYGSEENYTYLKNRGMEAYVKYPLFYQEQTGEILKLKFRRETFAYDAQNDT